MIESTGLARAGASAACWDGTRVAVVQVNISGTDVEGRPRSEVRIREREADADGFAGCCLALFHKRPIDSEAEWEHATMEIADRGHDRLAGRALSALADVWNPTQGGALATVAAPTIGDREEAADVCLIIRAVVALSGLSPPIVVAHSARVFADVWASDKWWTVLVAADGGPEGGPSSFAHVQRYLEANSRGFSELEFYGDKLLEPPSLERLQRAIFISTALEEAVRSSEDGPSRVDLPRLIDLQRRTENRTPARVWEVIRSQLHGIVASERFMVAPDAPNQAQGFVGDGPSVILELGTSNVDGLGRVRDLLGERVADQIRQAMEKKPLPSADILSKFPSASKAAPPPAKASPPPSDDVKARVSKDAGEVIAEIRSLPPGAARRAELSAQVCDLLKEDAPLDLFVAAKRTPGDRVAAGLTKLAPRWSGPREALEQPVSQIEADWLVTNGETILMTARRIGAETFAFWVPILVEALLRSADPPARLIEALLRTNQVGLDDSAALIRHSTESTDFVRQRALELWTSGHKLMGLETWLPRPTKATLDEGWDRLPEPNNDNPPTPEAYSDRVATLLWGFASRARHNRPTLAWARSAAGAVEDNADVMALRSLLHSAATWLVFARDLWLTGYGRLLDGVPFDDSHLEYIARDVRPDVEIDERHLFAPGTPSGLADIASERLAPWLRAARWTAQWPKEGDGPVEAVVEAWQSNDEGNRRAVHRYAWSMVAAKSPQPRAVWLERAWNAWKAQAGPQEPSIQFLKSFPAYLQVDLVALGLARLSEVQIMAKTSLPLINVFLLRGGGGFEAAVLYEIPVTSTWSMVAALPPAVSLPDDVTAARGEQDAVIQAAATVLDQLSMPFCLGVWNHTALSWREGRHAWVSSDGRVVCLNTDREPSWYEPMRSGFGGEPTQRMLAVVGAGNAPDEMLDAAPRARVMGRRAGRGATNGGSPWLSARNTALLAVLAVLVMTAGAMAFLLSGPSTPAPAEEPVAGPAAASEAVAASAAANGTPAGSAAERSPAAPPPPAPPPPAAVAKKAAACPFSPDNVCQLLRKTAPGAAAFCTHLRKSRTPFATVVANPARGPVCLKRKKWPKATARVYDKRSRRENQQFNSLLSELTGTACQVFQRRGCGKGECPSITANLKEGLHDLVAKRFARMLHNKAADRAVPNLTVEMPARLMDPRRKTGTAWLLQALPVSCAWVTLGHLDARLRGRDRVMARDFDRVQKLLPPFSETLARVQSSQ